MSTIRCSHSLFTVRNIPRPLGLVDPPPVRRNYRLISDHLSSTKPIYFPDRTALSPITRSFQEVRIDAIDKQLPRHSGYTGKGS